jgi:hypothetical protein
MEKIPIRVSISNGRIVITPPPGIELSIEADVMNDMLTIAEAAQKYGVSKNTLAKLCDTGGIADEVRGKNRFVRGADVEVLAKTPRRPGRKKKDI